MKIWRLEFCQATSSTVLTLVRMPNLRFKSQIVSNVLYNANRQKGLWYFFKDGNQNLNLLKHSY